MRKIKQKGFSLLEVMVALAILAFGITSLLIIRNRAFDQAGYAIRSRRISLLLEQKMAEISVGQEEDGEGDFTEQGYEEYTWEAEIVEEEIVHSDPEVIDKKYVVRLRRVELTITSCGR